MYSAATRASGTGGSASVPYTLVSAGGYSYMNSGSAFYLVSGAKYVYAYAAGVHDTAWPYDGSGILTGSSFFRITVCP